jgi:DNA-binding MarR family transcriptional regulator
MSEANPIRQDVQVVLDLIEESNKVMLAGGASAGWMDSELTLGQLRFIHVLAEERSLSISHVASHLGVTLTTASQFVDRLERPGYVERVHRMDDRRVVECRLTSRGRELIAAMRGMQRDGLAQLLRLLEPDELRDMERLFRVIGQRLSATSRSGAGVGQEEVDRDV